MKYEELSLSKQQLQRDLQAQMAQVRMGQESLAAEYQQHLIVSGTAVLQEDWPRG